jgi:preprotein translocase subunit YajC
MFIHLAASAHVLHANLLAATNTTAAKKSSGSSTIILFLVVILGAGYFLYMRPRSRARMAQAQQANQRTLEVGDEVATTAGIVGRVRRMYDDRIDLEIAPNMVIQVLRQNVGRPLTTSQPLPDRSEADDHWDDDTASLLAPGGIADDDEAEEDHVEDAPAAGPLSSGGARGSGSSGDATGGASQAKPATSPAGSRPARAARRSNSSGSAGWSRTSDDTSGGSGDGRAGSGS